MRARFACAGALLAACWLGQARAVPLDEAMQEARSLLARDEPNAKLDEDRCIALALELASGCPVTIDGDLDTAARQAARRALDHMNQIEQNYRGSTKMTSIRVGTGGMPCS